MQLGGIDAILVGDTYAEVCLGHETTLPATMEQMLTVTAAVRRGAPDVLLMGDMPYMSYQADRAEAVRNAGRFMSEAGCDCVKVEVDRRLASTVEAMATATIPVIAHLGLRPQSIHHVGGYRAQGKTADQAKRIIEDAAVMERCGAAGLLLEAVPSEVARMIAEATELPVIGCVAGAHCDGTVVVMHDMLGFGGGHPPRSVKQYANLDGLLQQAFQSYARDVKEGRFPEPGNGIAMDPAEQERLEGLLKTGSNDSEASGSPRFLDTPIAES